MKFCPLYCLLALLLLASVPAVAQPMSDLGLVGGSGMAFTPTIGVTPESHFRLDITRLSFVNGGEGGLNSYGITGGLSSNMEFSAKFQSLQAGTALSPSFIGFGGKFVFPFLFPFSSRIALWAEEVSTTSENGSALLPSGITRGALIIQPGMLSTLNANLFVGVTSAENERRLAAGCNASHVFNSFLKVGGEFQYNYYGDNDRQGSVLLLFRAHPNVCVQLSPGYLRSNGVSSWMFSAGVSVSTASIEFMNPEKPKEQPAVIPSFDDLEKQIHDEKKKD